MARAILILTSVLLAACASNSGEISMDKAEIAVPIPPAKVAPNCSDAAYRQFDFWIGEWQVTNPAGAVVGENRIEPILAGCALKESWKSASPHRGFSFNMYDAGRGVWHQTWVDNGGLLLRIEGQYSNGTMTLEGELPGKEGGINRHRIQWTHNPDGTVRQHWQSRSIGEPDWQTVFDGLYTPKL